MSSVRSEGKNMYIFFQQIIQIVYEYASGISGASLKFIHISILPVPRNRAWKIMMTTSYAEAIGTKPPSIQVCQNT